MKKKLFVLLLCFMASYALQAQTKEETISWLQEKLQKYIVVGEKAKNVKVIVNECFITISYDENEYYTNGNLYKTFNNQYEIIPTSGILVGININAKNKIKSIRCLREKSFENERFIWSSYFNITEGEENLYERLQKAVDHLATFCPQKQETF